ncbi:recombination regulator RecX [Streptomyces sp. NPDC056160]|uniref:recombination regulator RecX n=1 Tax=Streptomyces sp. NPDC056160 TaxID=3345731 RepID=UPI0035E04D58
MTRRTDWPEDEDGYAYPASGAPRGRGTGDRLGTGAATGPGVHRDDVPHGPERDATHRSGAYGDGAYGDGAYGDGDTYGQDPSDADAYGGGSDGGDAYGGDGRGAGRRRARGGPRGAAGPGTDGARRGGSRDGGSYGGRGRRRRNSGGTSATDGDISSSPRAEQGESPGDPVERARAICLRLLTGTPRTRKQLADALRKREIPDDAAEEVLSRFEEVGLIDDSAFADAWVESRHHGRGLARRALAQELRTKGVDGALIDEAVGRLDAEQEEVTARELVARKLRSTRGLDRDKRLRRLAGMLARKGYSQGLALRVVRQALEEEGEDTDFLGDEGGEAE